MALAAPDGDGPARPATWLVGSDRTMRGVGSVPLAASAGAANLAGLAVSSRTKQHHSSSDAAGHRQTGLVPFTATTRRGAQNLRDHKQHRQQTAQRTTSVNRADQSRTAAKPPDARVAPSL